MCINWFRRYKFFTFTGQSNWCNTIGYYKNSPFGDQPRCPADKPGWCICKWALARWIERQTCNDSIKIDCKATDICDLQQSYHDYGVDLKEAHECIKEKCPIEWQLCSSTKNEI